MHNITPNPTWMFLNDVGILTHPPSIHPSVRPSILCQSFYWTGTIRTGGHFITGLTLQCLSRIIVNSCNHKAEVRVAQLHTPAMETWQISLDIRKCVHGQGCIREFKTFGIIFDPELGCCRCGSLREKMGGFMICWGLFMWASLSSCSFIYLIFFWVMCSFWRPCWRPSCMDDSF